MKNKIKRLLFIMSVLLTITVNQALAYPLTIIDDQGAKITINKKPLRVVSLVPGITEIIFKIGEGDAVCGVTHFDTFPGEATLKTKVGGFLSPSIQKIIDLQPDYIFVSTLHESIIDYFAAKKCQIILLKPTSMNAIYHHIQTIGQIFKQVEKAQKCISDIQTQLHLISEKVSEIPENKRKRVARLMGRDSLMTPGINSFQNEYIRAAGGIPHSIDKKGQIIPVTLAEWKNFNPQMIYGCGGDRYLEDTLFQKSGWKDVDAIKQGNIHYFPCELTCRASTQTAYFVTWLSATLYPELFQEKAKKIYPEKIFQTQDVDLSLSFVRTAKIAFSHVNDLVCKTLMIDFKHPQYILSTLEGPVNGISTVGNHYFQPAYWQASHGNKIFDLKEKVCKIIDRPKEKTSILFTGADMENLVLVSKTYKDLTIHVLATAGVKSNAMRMSKDIGFYYKPGTINIIILSNRKLSSKAMTRSLITATEAKTAALWDMDIRSAYTPMKHPATGTGTDNIIVVQGSSGTIIDQTGGHTKAGELIARAVYDAVQQAIFKQNSLTPKRSIFYRFKERKLELHGLLGRCDCNVEKNAIKIELEKAILSPDYTSFMEMALAVTDDYENGLLTDLKAFEITCKAMIYEHTGTSADEIQIYLSDSEIPMPLQMALNTMIHIIQKKKKL